MAEYREVSMHVASNVYVGPEIWVTSFVVGCVGLLIGLIGLIAFWRSRVGVIPAYKTRTRRLIGSDDQGLSGEVQILFEGEEVPQLARSYVAFWNAGKKPLLGDSVVAADPLRIECGDRAEIKKAQVVRITREANAFRAERSGARTVEYRFDYLDPGDGALVEVLHTGGTLEVRGTTRGVPRGVRNRGLLEWSSSSPRRPTLLHVLILLIAGLGMCIAAWVMADEGGRLPAWLGCTGLGFILVGALLLLVWIGICTAWFVRGRCPRKLLPDEKKCGVHGTP
jgi:hypothetical protein